MKSRTAHRLLIGLGMVGASFALAAGIAIVANPGTADAPAKAKMDQYGAEVACESFIKDRTSAAATFSDEHMMGDGSLAFIIQGVVDAGSLHDTWTCTVRPDGDQWVLVTLDGIPGA